jgi:hypothetical protein
MRDGAAKPHLWPLVSYDRAHSIFSQRTTTKTATETPSYQTGSGSPQSTSTKTAEEPLPALFLWPRSSFDTTGEETADHSAAGTAL